MRRLAFIALLFATANALHAQVRPEALRAHMRFLSDDALEGRGTGTRGFRIAARYVAAQLETFGVPATFQNVPFRSTLPIGERSSIVLTRDDGTSATLRFAEGFVSSGDILSEDATVEAPVVFAGYGITAPDRQYDDYAGIDAKGKIVAYFADAPPSFPSDLRAHYSSSYEKARNAAQHGAVGTLSLVTPSDEERAPWPRRVRQSKLGSMYWLEQSGAPHAARPELKASATLSQSGLAALFEGAPTPLADVIVSIGKGNPRPFAMPVKARISIASRHTKVESPNVVGVLRGADPKLGNEYVVYSAHLDHLGISDPVDGDRINNGALDNASGIAAMLEIARAFSELPQRPRRSIIFLAVTGEEKGLRGADYFANNPTVPAASIVANINIDEILMFHPVRDVTPIGAEHSTLEAVVQKVAREQHVDVSPDPYPEEVVFVRSDQYPFVKAGIPAVYVGAGYRAVDPAYNILQDTMTWIKTIYHTPKDEMSQPIEYAVGVQVANFDFGIGLEVANADDRPAWKKGDFFGETFGHK
ncbi:MAG TPA: M28 family metallopeptidase [Thermoanaerobaculia bacterium]|nr:M28 family metallopeptidase [Thermoanaerobaculia bacterium]